jgi:hypothetical protein
MCPTSVMTALVVPYSLARSTRDDSVAYVFHVVKSKSLGQFALCTD